MKGDEGGWGSSGYRFSLADEAVLTKNPCSQQDPRRGKWISNYILYVEIQLKRLGNTLLNSFGATESIGA
jgi:hypothetical protein